MRLFCFDDHNGCQREHVLIETVRKHKTPRAQTKWAYAYDNDDHSKNSCCYSIDAWFAELTKLRKENLERLEKEAIAKIPPYCKLTVCPKCADPNYKETLKTDLWTIAVIERQSPCGWYEFVKTKDYKEDENVTA